MTRVIKIGQIKFEKEPPPQKKEVKESNATWGKEKPH